MAVTIYCDYEDMTADFGIAPPGFRLPAETHVGTVHLQVADLRRSVHYYGRVLGLRVIESSGASAALGAHGGGRPLIRLRERHGARPARGELGLYHFAILLPDRAALGRFAAHLMRLGHRVGMADHLVSESFYLSDPDGLGIEVYADRPRAAWTHHGREVAMTTDPLDVGSVIAAGAAREWDGMPEAATMGHLHLHVGDLERAEAYYHEALGFSKMMWSYPGALFLAAGAYHHHLGANTWSRGASASEEQARLLDWELVLPDAAVAGAAALSLRAAGHAAQETAHGWTAVDPWGTRLMITVGT